MSTSGVMFFARFLPRKLLNMQPFTRVTFEGFQCLEKCVESQRTEKNSLIHRSPFGSNAMEGPRLGTFF